MVLSFFVDSISQQQRILAALRDKIKVCYRAQGGSSVAHDDLIVTLGIDLNRDGSLAKDPKVIRPAPFSLGTDWAVNAVKNCAPYTGLDPEHYGFWKGVDINFDPSS